MNAKTFVSRPILSCVISALILIVGVIGLTNLPIEQFPNIAPPTVRVSFNYTGANAETVMKSSIVPIEEALNGVEGMMYMTSSASNSGEGNVYVYFRQGTDPDIATVNIQNRIAVTQSKLPAEVTKSGINIRKRQTSNIKSISLYSPDDSFDYEFLTNYLRINVEPRLSRVQGVGEVSIYGAEYAMRIWLDPAKMATYHLMPSDITQVLGEQNIESPTGTLGAESPNSFQYVLKYRGRRQEVHEYEEMVVKALPNGDVLRIKDVATVTLGSSSYSQINRVNGHPGINCSVSQTSGSNANDVIKAIDAEVANIRAELPKGMAIADQMSVKDFLDASIRNVLRTLLEAILLVVLVVYLFLHDWRSTLIPTLAIVVSLLGTLGVLYLIGYTLNLLTLFALVLVIGTVVDDAIIVVEAVKERIDSNHESPFKASSEAMGLLTTPIISITLVFMAVFIPVSFMGGTTGVFYRQFGITMAVAVAISCVNALTLSPALCALLLQPSHNDGDGTRQSFKQRFNAAFDTAMKTTVDRYVTSISRLSHHKWIVVTLLLLFSGLFAYLLYTTKTGFVPKEDQGSINVNVQTAPGTSLEATSAVMDRVDSCIAAIPQVRIYSRIDGHSVQHDFTPSAGSFTVRLKDWSERKGKNDNIDSVMEDIYRRTASITEAKIRTSTRSMISGYGSTSGFEMYVQDKQGESFDDLLLHTRRFINALNERPEVSRAFTNFDTKYPQYRVDVDASRCKMNGVSPSDVLAVLSDYVGGHYASNINLYTKLYRVMIQAPPEYRLDEHSLSNMYVRNASGQMTPISQYITLTRVYGSETVSRFNLFNAISVMGEAAPGYSSGQAIKAIREVAAETLPNGYSYEFAGMTREEASMDSSSWIVFAVCILFIYLILCALYESILIPLSVILAVPFGLAGSLIFANLFGVENNIYLQISLVMLIGLLSKTAILISEYATKRREAGLSIVEAAADAARMRLRPIVMTALTMIVGLLPLCFSHGVGANGNRSVGMGAVGGMLVGTIALLFVTPVFFIIFKNIEEKIAKRKTTI
ncbi:MAG: efflux RND transporter permease subunit [Bacteroidales bacterium]|nr:efflux RND transporter permease subunit [Bacteroidales bacterium]